MRIDLGPVILELPEYVLDLETCKFETELTQPEGRMPIHHLKIWTPDRSRLYFIVSVIEVLGNVWIVNPDKNNPDAPDLFTIAYSGAAQENMEDITVTPDIIGGHVAAIITGKAAVGSNLIPVIKAVWGPRTQISGMISRELVVVTSFMPLMKTAKFLECLKITIKHDEFNQVKGEEEVVTENRVEGSIREDSPDQIKAMD